MPIRGIQIWGQSLPLTYGSRDIVLWHDANVPIITEKSLITSKQLEIDMSLFLTTNRKSLVGFQNMRSDLKFGAPSGGNRQDVTSGYRKTPNIS